jgi:PAS domain S-box-containing protein/diguanylate cyclase (GGDEF)-like protein
MLELKLMIVEDDQELRETLSKILSREVREVRSFSHASEALKAFTDYNPEIIITDIKMPNMSGLEMIELMKKLYGEVPVIILSAFSESEYFIKAIDLKVNHFLTKPVDITKLLNMLEDMTHELDISNELQEQKILLDQYKQIVDLSSNITITDNKGIITYVNDKFCELSGYSREELIGNSHNIVRHPDMPKSFYKNMWRTILNKEVWQGTIKNFRKDKTLFYVETTITPVLDKDNNIVEYISIKTNITDLILSQDELQKQIITDSLTSLYNRIKLQEDIRYCDDLTLMIIDINRFKEINLLFGVNLGDEALLYMAKTLKELSASLKGTTIYRISGDEFCILKGGKYVEEFKEFANTLNEYIDINPFKNEDISFNIDITCAIAYKDDKKQNILESVHDALDFAKKTKSSVHVFDALVSRQREYEENFQWTKKIKEALANDRIKAFFQPIYSVSESKIVKYESLVRLIDLDGRVVPPHFFLHVAKLSHLYSQITKTMIIQACKTFEKRKEIVTLNFSIEDLLDSETIDFFIKTVKQHKMQNKVIAEILESEGVDNFETIKYVLKHLHDNGIGIAIDDFGSGYSNFSYLAHLEIDILKIDGSLIRNIQKDENSKIIVQSIAMFSNQLGMKNVAEFVSDKDIYKNVKNIGIDLIQGYYISEPLSEPLEEDAVITL